MKGKTFAFVVLAFLACAFAIPAAAQSLLPASFGEGLSAGAPAQVQPPQLEQLAGNQAPILREYGVSSAERRDYSNGTDRVTVTLYRMEDPSAAFGAFTFLREPGMASFSEPDPVSYAAQKGGDALLVIGNLVLDVKSAKMQSVADLNGLAQAVSPKADHRPYPPIAEFLPKDGLIPGSERYVLGPLALAQAFAPAAQDRSDWAGFASSAEAMVGRYRISANGREREAALLLIVYPTQQLAADRYNVLAKSFALNVDPSQANGRPVVFGTRSSALIALLSGVDSREAAVHMLTQVHYSSQVTWDEPTHDVTDPSISTIVVGAIVDTGAIMLLVLAVSLGFGGFRVIAKLVAPGKIFDRNADIEILQLGINSKPVDVKDFYAIHSSR